MIYMIRPIGCHIRQSPAENMNEKNTFQEVLKSEQSLRRMVRFLLEVFLSEMIRSLPPTVTCFVKRVDSPQIAVCGVVHARLTPKSRGLQALS